MRDALEQKKQYEAQKVSRLIARTNKGPRGRVYVLRVKPVAPAYKWVEKMQKEGKEGGCSGELVDLQELDEEAEENAQEHLQTLAPAARLGPSTEDKANAEKDYKGITRASWSLTCWRAWPPWSFPGPVLRILLQPKWTHKRVERLGIGAAHPEEQWE